MPRSFAITLRSAGIRWRPSCAFLVLFLCLHLPWAALRPLAAPDEIRYAEIAREMLATGDWIVPHLAGAPYLEKPPLGIWIGACAQALCGRSALALRLPALLSTLLTACLLARFLRRRGRDADEAWGVASIFASFAFVQAIGTAQVLDPLLSCALTGATLALADAAFALDRRERRRALLRSGLWLGAAFLVKGFVAWAMFVATALPFVWLSASGRSALRGLPLVLGASILVALPWSLAVSLREPSFWHRFLWVEHVQRFLSNAEAQHAQPFWYFVPVLVLGALPWLSIGALATRPRADDAERQQVTRLGLCWVLGPLLFLSASSGKLGTYLMPCFPGLALVVGDLMERHSSEVPPGARRGLVVLAGVVALATLTVLALLLLPEAPLLQLPSPRSGSAILWLAGGLGSAGLLLRAARAVAPGDLRRRLAWSLAPLSCAAALAFPRSIQSWRQPEAYFARHADWLRSTGALVAEYRILVSLCWSLETTEIELVGKRGELDSSHRHQPLSIAELRERLGGDAPESLRLACRASWWRDHASSLPAPAELLQEDGIVLARFGAR